LIAAWGDADRKLALPRELRTARLHLRRWRAGDRAPFAALNADPRVMEHFAAPLSREESDALAALGLDEIVSFTAPGNRASRRVMERIGMVHDPADDFDHPRCLGDILAAGTCCTESPAPRRALHAPEPPPASPARGPARPGSRAIFCRARHLNSVGRKKMVLRARPFGVLVVASLVVMTILAGATAVNAQEVLTNDGVIKMVKAGLAESVIIQKIRTSQKKFDTSTDGLIKLKGAGVPDKVIEAMVGGAPASAPATAAAPPPPPAAPAAPEGPTIAHLVGNAQKPLKSVLGNVEFSVEPFGGSKQEVVLAEPRAQYRITDKEPVFVSPNTDQIWILVRLKPGKRDRNLPMSSSGGGWVYSGTTFRQGVDPKYAIKLDTQPAARGGTQMKPAEPLKPGEYGFVSANRGQINVNEVFDFAVE
jgi:hypothetical protein